jgi:hypothetical protein
MLPVDRALAAAVAVAAAVVVAVLLARTTTAITVADGELHVGVAHVPLSLVARAEVLDGPASRRALGPELDARAFVCTRPWVRTAVRVHLRDPDDPTPYWLVATRRPGDLARALASGSQPGAGDQAAHSEHTS